MTSKTVWINGLSGRMGVALQKSLAKDEHFDFIGGAGQSDFEVKISQIEKADLVIDFSSPSGSKALLAKLQEKNFENKAFLICTTGLEEDTIKNWESLGSKNKVMVAPNTSLGILLALKAARSISKIAKEEGFDFILEETHHRYKKDAPSGTALFLGETIAKENKLEIVQGGENQAPEGKLTIHASRGGGVFGEHTIRLISDYEEISIGHRAFSRDLFAKGALYLGKWLVRQRPSSYNLVDFSSH